MAIIPSDEKVFMVDKRTNTIYGGSAALQAMQQWYTMEDISNTVKPYKVFTALLTQSGESQPYDVYEGTDLYIGLTYVILSYEEGPTGDFTNVGAPNNEIGTYFVATGATPNSWGTSYLQYDSGAPFATVLENTIGNIWFGYNTAGNYSINSNGLFILNKTVQFINGLPFVEGNLAIINNTEVDFLYLQSISSGGELTDGLFASTPIEIRVYN